MSFPNDLQELDYEDAAAQTWHVAFRRRLHAPEVVPYDVDLQRAADVLNAGKKVAMLVGAGALHATDEVIAVADKLGSRRRESAARQSRAARRSALGHGLDRPARHQAELRL